MEFRRDSRKRSDSFERKFKNDPELYLSFSLLLISIVSIVVIAVIK